MLHLTYQHSLLNMFFRFLYQGREVSYSSVLAQSINRRRDTLYKSRGFDVERWAELVNERKSLSREIGRIAEDYEERQAKEFKNGAGEGSVVWTGAAADLKEDNVEPEPSMEVGREEALAEKRIASKSDNR